MCDAQLLEEPGHPQVAHRKAESARLVTQSAREPGLAGAGGTGDAEVLVALQPVAESQTGQVAAVDAARVAVVNLLDTGVDPQSGGLEQPGQAAVVAVEALLLDEQG